jgi:hypothetical protein
VECCRMLWNAFTAHVISSQPSKFDCNRVDGDSVRSAYRRCIRASN